RQLLGVAAHSTAGDGEGSRVERDLHHSMIRDEFGIQNSEQARWRRRAGNELESSMTKEEILLAQNEHLFPCVFHYYKEPLVISHAKNQYVWDADGNQYLDFFGGIVTVSVGHCNDSVNRALHAQIDKLQHVSTVFANEPQAALAKKLAQITPGGKLTKSFF